MTTQPLRAGYLLALVPLLLAVAVTANATDLKIGYVSPARVTDEAPQAEAAREDLEREFEPRNQELVSMRNELRELEDVMQTDGPLMAEDEQQRRQREIVSLRRELQRAQEAFREDLNMRRNELLADLQKRVVQTIGDFAREEDYDLVVSDGVFYASDSIDITDRIIERLQTEFQSRQN